MLVKLFIRRVSVREACRSIYRRLCVR